MLWVKVYFKYASLKAAPSGLMPVTVAVRSCSDITVHLIRTRRSRRRCLGWKNCWHQYPLMGYYPRIQDSGQCDVNLIYLTTRSSQNPPEAGFQKQMVALRLAGPVSAIPQQYQQSCSMVLKEHETRYPSVCLRSTCQHNERLGWETRSTQQPSPSLLLWSLPSTSGRQSTGSEENLLVTRPCFHRSLCTWTFS